MTTCCLNPNCHRPLNPDNNRHCQTCGTPLSDLLDNRYKVVQPLARGGCGKAYLAEDTRKFNERCVVKQFAYQAGGTQATQKAMQLFEQEAMQLQQFDHPQIPKLLAYFQENNYFYLVQEFIEGQDLLRELGTQGAFSEAKIQELLFDLLPIIKYIHEHGVIHRDIKPDNIMRRQSDGKLVLIDFGVSKLAQTGRVQTRTKLGSGGYAPLEQMRLGKVTPASDLFSLGATCFHLLTEIAPLQLLEKHDYSWVDNWQQYLRFPLSLNLNHVLGTLLQKDQQHRYQSASTALRELQFPSSGTSQGSVGQPQNTVPPPSSSSPVSQYSPPQFSPHHVATKTVVQPNLVHPASTSSPTRRTTIGWNFWFRWVIANYLGYLVSFIIALILTFIITFITAPLFVDRSSASFENQVNNLGTTIGIFIGAPILGFGIGIAQWLVLKKWVSEVGWWIAAYTCASILTAVGGQAGFIGGALFGAISGTILWSVIKEQISRSKWLIPYWSIGAAMGSSIAATGAYDSPDAAVSIMVLSVLFGVPINASIMTWILRR